MLMGVGCGHLPGAADHLFVVRQAEEGDVCVCVCPPLMPALRDTVAASQTQSDFEVALQDEELSRWAEH